MRPGGGIAGHLHFFHQFPSVFVNQLYPLTKSCRDMPSTASKFVVRLCALALGLGLMSAPLAPAAKAADDLIVNYDQSTLYELPRPVAQIIVGNPAIADITVKSPTILVVTGKTFGITNFIILDSENKVIKNQRILVRRDEAKVVNLQRGINRQSYNCAPQCNPSIIIGDESAYFESIARASQNKIGFSERAAEPGAAPAPANNN